MFCITFQNNPKKEDFIKSLNVARIFGNDIKKSFFIVYEIIDIEDQIIKFLRNFKRMEWNIIQNDMTKHALMNGRIMSICGKTVKYSDTLINDYMKQSKKDIINNILECTKKYNPIAISENSVIYPLIGFVDSTPDVLKSIIEQSIPKISKLFCKYYKI